MHMVVVMSCIVRTLLHLCVRMCVCMSVRRGQPINTEPEWVQHAQTTLKPSQPCSSLPLLTRYPIYYCAFVVCKCIYYYF